MLNLISFVIIVGLLGCGVKGKPLPPLEPPPIGTGHPAIQKKDEKKNTQKR